MPARRHIHTINILSHLAVIAVIAVIFTIGVCCYYVFAMTALLYSTVIAVIFGDHGMASLWAVDTKDFILRRFPSERTRWAWIGACSTRQAVVDGHWAYNAVRRIRRETLRGKEPKNMVKLSSFYIKKGTYWIHKERSAAMGR
jgi:hypothetical protein